MLWPHLKSCWKRCRWVSQDYVQRGVIILDKIGPPLCSAFNSTDYWYYEAWRPPTNAEWYPKRASHEGVTAYSGGTPRGFRIQRPRRIPRWFSPIAPTEANWYTIMAQYMEPLSNRLSLEKLNRPEFFRILRRTCVQDDNFWLKRKPAELNTCSSSDEYAGIKKGMLANGKWVLRPHSLHVNPLSW